MVLKFLKFITSSAIDPTVNKFINLIGYMHRDSFMPTADHSACSMIN